MASVHTLQPLVEPFCKGAPVILVQDQLMQAARNFMLFTRWQRATAPINVEANARYYTVVSADTTMIPFAIVAAAFDGEPLEPQKQANVRPGTSGFYFFVPPNEILLSWPPAADIFQGLVVESCLVAKPDATQIPDGLVQRWGDYLAYGALSQLLNMPNTKWYAPVEAKKYLGLWASGNEQAHYEANNQAKAYTLSNSQGPSG